VGIFSIVSIAPEEVTIASGPPEERRLFLDIILCQTSKRYLSSLSRYQRVLAQRNGFLREHRGEEPRAKLREELYGWSQQLAEFGSEIVSIREKFAEHLRVKLQDFYRQITDSGEAIEISYQISGNLRTDDSLVEQIIERLSKSLKRELLIGTTTVGPHRDDLEIEIDGHNIRQFGSQGQMRSVLLALKLAAADYISQLKGEGPIIILDEVFSELDERRTEALLRFILRGGQVFIATSRRAEIETIPPEHCSTFYIESGSVKSLALPQR
jgi:DNA replication and repair protein RecF